MKTMRRVGLFLLLALILMVLPSCMGGPDPTFVAAARASHDAITPEYLGYVDKDPGLSGEQRERRHRTVARWDEAIRSREVRR